MKDPNTKQSLDAITSDLQDNSASATQTIAVTAPWNILEPRLEATFNQLAKNLKVDGFRPGKIPVSVAKARLPEILVLEQASRDLIAEIYLPLLKKHQVDGIGEPQISISKLAPKNDLEFSITLFKAPEVDLNDYQSVRNDADNAPIQPTVTDEELDQAIETLRHQWAQQEQYQQLASEDPEAAKQTDPRQISVPDDKLPTVDDAWVAQLGPYKTVDEFREGFRTNIIANQANQELDKQRSELLGAIINQAEFRVPDIVYQAETDRLLQLQEAEVKQAGIKFDDYLTTIQKTRTELRESLTDQARDNVHAQLVIAEIAKQQKLAADPDQATKEVEYLKQYYPDANPANLVAYVQSHLVSQLVMQWLLSPAAAKPDDKPANKSETKSKKKGSKKGSQPDKKDSVTK